MTKLLLLLLLTTSVQAQTIGILDNGGIHGALMEAMVSYHNPDATVIRKNVFNEFEDGKYKYADAELVMMGLLEMMALGVDRINMSLSSSYVAEEREGTYTEIFKALTDEGVAVYCAAGNQGEYGMGYPAADPYTFSCTAPGMNQHPNSLVVDFAYSSSEASAVCAALGGAPDSGYGSKLEIRKILKIKKVRYGRRRTRITFDRKFRGVVSIKIGDLLFENVKVRGRRVRLFIPRSQITVKSAEITGVNPDG